MARDKSITQAAFLITVFTLITSLIGFASQVATASVLGAGMDLDVYLAVSALPVALISILTNVGTFIIIPIFQDSRVKKGETAAWAVVSSIFWIFFFGLLGFSVVNAIFSKNTLDLLLPGFRSTPQEILAVRLSPWIWATVFFSGITAFFSGIHNCYERFGLPSFSLALPNIGMVIFTLILGKDIGVYALAIGQFVGVVFQAILLTPFMIKSGRLQRPTLSTSHDTKRVIYLTLPLLAGGFLHNAIPVVDRFFASQLPVGSISHLSYAARIAYFSANLISQGISTAIFPRLSKDIAENNRDAVHSTLSLSIRLICVLMIPIILLSPIYSRSLVAILLRRGSFTTVDVEAVATALPIYIAAYGVGTLGTIITRGFFALHDSRTPFITGALFFLGYIAIASRLVVSQGYMGLAITCALFWGLTVLTNGLLLRRMLGGLGGKTISFTVLKALVAGFATLAGATIVLHRSQIPSPLFVITIVCAAALTYFALLGTVLCSSEIRKLLWTAKLR